MVYTIISKLPFITSDKSNRRFFKIFVFGSLIYILLHYYLYQKDQEGILDNIKTYLYYCMAIDLCIAYALDQWFSSNTAQSSNTEEKSDNLPNNQNEKVLQKSKEQPQQTEQLSGQNKYSPEQRVEYERKYAEWQKQQLKEKEIQIQQLQNKKNQIEKKEARVEEELEDNEFEEEISLPNLNNKKGIGIEKSEKSESKGSGRISEDTDIPRFRKTN